MQRLVAIVSIAACWGACGLTWVVGALYNALREPKQSTRAPLRPVVILAVIAWAIFFAIFRAVPTHSWQPLGVHSS